MNDHLVHLGGMWCPAGDPYFGPRLMSADGPLWDGQTMNAALECVTDWRLAVDVGAHIGTWTRQLAPRFDAVVAFEPDALNFEALQENLGGVGNTRLLPLALAKSPGRFSLSHDGTVNSGQGYLTPLQDGQPWVVCVTLDMLALEGVGLLKLDVEGLECDVIAGAEQTIRGSRPVVVLEENVCAQRYGRVAGEARRMLEDWGMFEAKRIEFAENNFDVVMKFGEPSCLC